MGMCLAPQRFCGRAIDRYDANDAEVAIDLAVITQAGLLVIGPALRAGGPSAWVDAANIMLHGTTDAGSRSLGYLSTHISGGGD